MEDLPHVVLQGLVSLSTAYRLKSVLLFDVGFLTNGTIFMTVYIVTLLTLPTTCV